MDGSKWVKSGLSNCLLQYKMGRRKLAYLFQIMTMTVWVEVAVGETYLNEKNSKNFSNQYSILPNFRRTILNVKNQSFDNLICRKKGLKVGIYNLFFELSEKNRSQLRPSMQLKLYVGKYLVMTDDKFISQWANGSCYLEQSYND